MNQKDNSENIELRKTVKIYYPMTSELREKARKFGVSSRKKYVTLENNPFGMKAGILFTGAGIDSAMSKVRVEFLTISPAMKGGKIQREEWDKLQPYIRIVSNAVAYDTIVSAKGHMKKGDMFNIPSDVERNNHGFNDFFYDEEKEQIYRWEVKEV